MSAAIDAAVDSAIVPVRRFVPKRLGVVTTSARRRPRRIYGLIAVAGALAIAATQMGLSILTTQTSYELSSLTSQQRNLTWQKQILSDELTGLASPQYLAANATALGMVIGESPSYLRLSDGALLGPGQASSGGSSVDALGRASVPNELVAKTPLVTNPDASILTPTPAPTPSETAQDSAAQTEQTEPTPPPLTDGLPSPSTH